MASMSAPRNRLMTAKDPACSRVIEGLRSSVVLACLTLAATGVMAQTTKSSPTKVDGTPSATLKQPAREAASTEHVTSPPLQETHSNHHRQRSVSQEDAKQARSESATPIGRASAQPRQTSGTDKASTRDQDSKCEDISPKSGQSTKQCEAARPPSRWKAKP